MSQNQRDAHLVNSRDDIQLTNGVDYSSISTLS